MTELEEITIEYEKLNLTKAHIAQTQLAELTQILSQSLAKNADQELTIARLTAGSEAMQEDARNNTATIKAQAEEIRTLKQELDQLKACKHMHVKIHSRLYRPSTREEPAEFEYKAECKDCGELFSADDVDEWAEVEE